MYIYFSGINLIAHYFDHIDEVLLRVQKIMGSITGRVKRKDYAIASPSSMQR
jgi:hypothetical protein